MRAHIRIVLIGLIGVLGVSAPASAQMLNEAVEAWLADDDETALPLLGALANLGDAEAQLFLGQIERVTPPGADSPFVRSLNRRERISLLRAPKGLSGTSWTVMRQREGDPLADALMVSRLPDAGIDTAQYLFAQGEEQAGARLAFEIFDRGNFNEILSLAPGDPLINGLDFVAWMRTYFGNPPGPNAWAWLETTPPTGRSSGLMMVNFVAPVLAPHLKPGPDLRNFILAMRGSPTELIEANQIATAAEVLSRQMETDPVLAPVRGFCERSCGDQMGFCALEVITMVGGYDRLTFLDTPYETVVSQERFASSERAIGSLTRWMVAVQGGALNTLGGGTTISQCVQNVVESETERLASELAALES